VDEAFALLVLENIWDVWIKMDPLEFFSRKRCATTDNTTEETTNDGLVG